MRSNQITFPTLNIIRCRSIGAIICLFSLACQPEQKDMISLEDARLQKATEQVGIQFSNVVEQKSVSCQKDKKCDFFLAESIDPDQQTGKLVLLEYNPAGELFRYEVLNSQLFLKSETIRVSDKRSHALFIFEQSSKDFLLLVREPLGMQQSLTIPAEFKHTLRIERQSDDVLEEHLVVDEETRYFFDGFQYTKGFLDQVRPVFFDVLYKGADSWIRMVNRGAYSGKVFITFSFPELEGNSDYEDKVLFSANIPTVSWLPPRSKVKLSDGTDGFSKTVSIEVTKMPWRGNTWMRLPLMVQKEAGKMLVRAVFYERNNVRRWPSSGVPGLTKKDQQGYHAYIFDPNKKGSLENEPGSDNEL